jgi:VanZ family protein
VKWLALLFALFILLVIALANMGKVGVLGFVNRIPLGDKAGHFLLYGLLALLIDLNLFRSLPSQSRRLLAVKVALILALLIGLEEASQLYLVNRTFSLADLFASYLGVLLFSWMAIRKQ